MNTAQYWIQTLDLIAHPEGGYFREVFRSPEQIAAAGLPNRYPGARAFATSIYFLLKDREFSALHRLQSDEIWYFHAGSGLTVYTIDAAGTAENFYLGPNPNRGQALQVVIPRGTWFGAAVDGGKGYCLTGCNVAPGFEFADFEMGGRKSLLELFPRHRDLILSLTHPD